MDSITASGAVVIRGPEQALTKLANEVAIAVGRSRETIGGPSIGCALIGRTDGYYLVIAAPDALVEELAALKQRTTV